MPISSSEPATWPDRIAALDARLGSRRFCLWLAVIAFVVLQVVASPNGIVELLLTGDTRGPDSSRLFSTYAPIAAAPFSSDTPGAPQFRLRLLGPALAWAVHLPGVWSGLTAWLATLPALYLVARLAHQTLHDHPRRAWLATLLTLALAASHPFVIGNVLLGHQDTLAALFVLVAMRYRAWWVATPALVVAMLADERAIGAAGLVLCWHWLHDAEPRRIVLARLRVLACAAALGLWTLFAWAMLRHVGMTFTDLTAPAFVRTDWMAAKLPINFYLPFRAAWLQPAAALLAALTSSPGERRERLTLCAAALLMTIPLFIAACRVGDVSRVVGLGFPVVLLAVAALARWRPQYLTPTLVCAAALNLLAPIATGIGTNTYPLQSAPMSLLLYLLGIPRS